MLQVPLYLELLNIEPEAEQAIEAIREASHRSGANLEAELCALLSQDNWRPQLVGGTALVVLGGNESRLAALWAALDRPCWVSPQLAVVAALVDPAFESRAQERIHRRCALDADHVLSMDWVRRHSAMGPGSITSGSNKLLSALMRLCERRPSASVWLTPYLEAEDIRQMIASDVDHGGDIAERWLEGMLGLLKR